MSLQTTYNENWRGLYICKSPQTVLVSLQLLTINGTHLVGEFPALMVGPWSLWSLTVPSPLISGWWSVEVTFSTGATCLKPPLNRNQWYQWYYWYQVAGINHSGKAKKTNHNISYWNHVYLNSVAGVTHHSSLYTYYTCNKLNLLFWEDRRTLASNAQRWAEAIVALRDIQLTWKKDSFFEDPAQVSSTPSFPTWSKFQSALW